MFHRMNVLRASLPDAPEQQKPSCSLVIPTTDERPGGNAPHADHPHEDSLHSRLAVLLDGIGDAFYSLDRDWRFTSLNRAAKDYFGVTGQGLLGRVIWDVFPHSEGTD